MAALHFSQTKALAQLTWIAQTTRVMFCCCWWWWLCDGISLLSRKFSTRNDCAHMEFSTRELAHFPTYVKKAFFFGKKIAYRWRSENILFRFFVVGNVTILLDFIDKIELCIFVRPICCDESESVHSSSII